ncbi:MAG: CBS domain-containing protein [Desulfobulbaceae bacterium]|nr:CBS domain-containing protein [Desulfobulbaceae bacterium]
MSASPQKNSYGTIEEIIGQQPERPLPLINATSSVAEVIDAFITSCHSRLLYVVDDQNKLQGVISLGHLARHIFFHYHDHHVDTRHLISMAVSETAGDLMQRKPLYAELAENVEDVLQRMISHNVKEIPIVDTDHKVKADLTMVDILKQHKARKGSEF